MHLTVEQAMSVYPLSEGRLIAGLKGKHRIVKSVNVMDAPDIWDWIKEGEMLLTTAYLIKDHPEDGKQLLHKLNQRGSSGLGIKLGRFWDDIPESLAAEADALGFPLIQLPYQFTFSDMMNGLFKAEMQRSMSALQEVLEKQKRLMRFALQPEQLRQLFDAVTEVIGYPLAVVGPRGKMVYNATEVGDAQLLQGWPWSNRHQWIKGRDWQAFRVPLLKGTECTGFVYFFSGEALFTTIEEGLFHQAAELLAYQMNFSYQDPFERMLYRDLGALIKRYLNSGLSAAELADYADKLDIKLFREPYQCVLTDVTGQPGETARTANLERLKEEYASHPAIHELGGIHVIMDEGLLSVFPADSRAEKLPDHLSACFNSLKPLGDLAPKAAISTRQEGEERLAASFSEVKETLRLAVKMGIADTVVESKTLEFAYLFEQVSKERMNMYCEKVLTGLLSKDPEYSQDMLRTLEVYLDNDGQLSETAKKLFVHRNTASYRIEKISEALEVDLKKVDDLLRLKLVFLFRRMMGRGE
ncbi:PucR family transcriptional regulator [Paenibacillus beijingensis]|uniref:PucR family transcriptional regulator n=1 Tax=Paenibacillus beijingensis TaxID=1126833 RepID=A0A0D5NKX1_9BACL|nr:PucR family transcriptional regulator [Paenibacillus beijingensis]AJY75583.1 PucR family transcriptional regulator [Paenibacillus beijingensis]